MANQYSIHAESVIKHFGKTKALDGVSLKADYGKVTGLLGPNGSGKTTLIKIMSSLLEPTQGKVLIDGIDVHRHPNQVRNIIGLAGQYAAVDDYLTGRETLEMVGRLYHMPKKEIKKRSNELLQQLGLEDAADRQTKTYSGGMRRRLDLGASLVSTPKVLFLDEPTTGLDPRTRLQLWSIIQDLVTKGVSILLTTQYLEEADALADKMYVLNHGKVIAKGTSGSLKSSLGVDIIEVIVKQNQLILAQKSLTQKLNKTITIDELTRRLQIKTKNGSDDILLVAQILHDIKIKPEELSLHRPSLDDVFMSLTAERNHNA